MVLASVVENKPLAMVLPLVAPNTLAVPPLLTVTVWPPSGLPNASRTTKEMIACALPSAAVVLGEMVNAEVLADGAPPTKEMVTCRVAGPAVSTIDLLSALFERRVDENCPDVVVAPLIAPNVSLPPVLLVANETFWLGTTFA